MKTNNKNNRLNLLLIGMLFLLFFQTAMAQTQTTLEQTFVPEEDCTFMVLALNGPVNVTYGDNNIIRVNTKIVAPEVGMTTLEQIIEKGRYHTEYRFYEEERFMLIDLPEQEEPYLLNGVLLEEYLEFDIQVPHGTRVKVIQTYIPLFL